MSKRRWKSQRELAEMIITKALKGQNVTLSAETAHFVGLRLRREGGFPTRTAIALMICGAKCDRPCYICTGKANEIVAAYGCNVDETPAPPESDRA